jgi:hypothetical protein
MIKSNFGYIFFIVQNYLFFQFIYLDWVSILVQHLLKIFNDFSMKSIMQYELHYLINFVIEVIQLK